MLFVDGVSREWVSSMERAIICNLSVSGLIKFDAETILTLDKFTDTFK